MDVNYWNIFFLKKKRPHVPGPQGHLCCLNDLISGSAKATQGTPTPSSVRGNLRILSIHQPLGEEKVGTGWTNCLRTKQIQCTNKLAVVEKKRVYDVPPCCKMGTCFCTLMKGGLESDKTTNCILSITHMYCSVAWYSHRERNINVWIFFGYKGMWIKDSALFTKTSSDLCCNPMSWLFNVVKWQ